MMLVVTLKNNRAIKATLQEEDEQYHCKGVLHKESVIDTLRDMEQLAVKDFCTYSDLYAIGIIKPDGVCTYISPEWIDTITDGTDTYSNLLAECTTMVGYIEFKDDVLVDLKKHVFVDKTTLPICRCCGKLIENDKALVKEKQCRECFLEEHYVTHNYTYKPTPEFIGSQIKSNEGCEVWYGIELEYGYNEQLDIAKLAKKYPVYLKPDTSIREGSQGGIEVVTHPHSFTKLMGDDSFVSDLNTIDCIDDPNSNGCHVHVSRTAWMDDKHYALTYFLMYEMGKLGVLEQLGGREFTSYCELEEPKERIYQVKKDYTKEKDRSRWLNENNNATVEFRFFASTNDSDQLRRYIQLLESVIKYTKFHKKSVSINGLLSYIDKKRKKYKQLADFLDDTEIDNKIVTYREPKLKEVKYNKLTVGNVPFIVTVVSDNNTYIECTDVYVDGRYLYFYTQGIHTGVRLTEIQSVVVEV